MGEPIVVVLSDNIFRDSLAAAIHGFRHNPVGAMILLKEVEDPERFGVATVEADRVVGIAEKPPVPRSRLAVTGCIIRGWTTKDGRVVPGEYGLGGVRDEEAKSISLTSRNRQGIE